MRIRFRAEETYSGVMCFHLNTWTGAGSLTVGPRGPLVRFDRAPFPLLPLPERGRDSGDRRRRLAPPGGALGGGMDPPLQGGPPGGRQAGGDGGSYRWRAPRRRWPRELLGAGLWWFPSW